MLAPQQRTRASAGGGCVNRTLRLLLLLVLALTALEYLFGFIRTSPLTSVYKAMQPTLRNTERIPASLKKISLTDFKIMKYAELNSELEFLYTHTETPAQNLTKNNHTVSNVMREPIDLNMTRTKFVEDMNSSAKNETTSTSILITKILEYMNGSEVVNKSDSAPVTLPMCENESDLGLVPANKSEMELHDVEKKFPEVQWGGRYTPPNCTAKHKVAIIVPYRNRQMHLAIFLNHIHPFLMKQQIGYGIYIVEQNGTKPFNRAKVLNVGFMESQKLEPGGFKCFIFHDIDLLPVDTRNLYSCTRQPRHLAGSLPRFKFKFAPHRFFNFGGVTAMTLEQILTVNGFSNMYWGWGGEDSDMYYRVHRKNYRIARRKISMARFTHIGHTRGSPNPKRYKLLSSVHKRSNDGLSSLRYKIINVVQHHLYTHILANIDEISGISRLSLNQTTHVPRGARLHKKGRTRRSKYKHKEH